MKLIKINQDGVAHWIAPLLVIALVTVVGVRIIVASHADSPNAVSSATPAKPSQTITDITNSQDLATGNGINPNDPITAWESDLEAKFPNQYAGVSVNSDGSFSVSETTPDSDLQQYAASDLNAQMSKYGLSSTNAPVINFPQVRHSYQDLRALATKIVNQQAAPPTSPNSVNAVSINEQTNQVQVGTNSTNTGAVGSTVKANAGVTDSSEVSVSHTVLQTPLGSSRIADSAPWNGGDEIFDTRDSYSGSAGWCTTGPGVHNSSGTQFSLTAGHCGTTTTPFMNTGVTSPGLTLTETGPKVGLTYLYSDADTGTAKVPGLDSELIYTQQYGGSSDITWAGGPLWEGTSRVTFTGYATPPVGATVCSEGYNGQLCGKVTTTPAGNWESEPDTGPGYGKGDQDIYSFEFAGTAIPGDSGSPVYWNTAYGPLCVGVLVAAGGGITMVVPIVTILYDYSSEYKTTFSLNTVSNP